MKFCDKLAKLRKSNNLSQEQLADKLGVSRQAVSKWESGSSYPDMDKIINICKILNCNLDDLLEDGIIESKSKNTKIDFNSYLGNFLNFITKSYNMFWSMKFKEKLKCLLELSIISLILLICGMIIYFIIDDLIFDNFRGIFGVNILIEKIVSPLFIIALIVIGIIVFLHLFKIRYLDYFITIEDNNVKEKKLEKALAEEKIVDNKKYIVESPKEKIVIRDPKHSTFNFFNILTKLIVLIIKLFVIMCIIPFIIFTLMVIIFGAIDITFIPYGSMFIFILMAVIGTLLISFVIIDFAYNFIFNRNIKFKLMFILFICGLSLLGIGSGISLVKFMDYDYKTTTTYDIVQKEEIIQMKDNIIFLENSNINYIIDDSINDLKIIVTMPKNSNYYVYPVNSENYDIYHISFDGVNAFSAYSMLKEDLKNHIISNYEDIFKVDIYLSQENYDIMQNNLENYYTE